MTLTVTYLRRSRFLVPVKTRAMISGSSSGRSIRWKHFMSKIYRPCYSVPRITGNSSKGSGRSKGDPPGRQKPEAEPLSRSLQMMLETGVIRPSSCSGAYHLLPVGVKALEKLVTVVDHFMETAGCQKIQMPILTADSLWKTTGRIDEYGQELMKVSDRHSKSYVLSPTHEEAVCDLINCNPISHRMLPLKLYQVTEKFRDEIKPRFGLMRGRQFLMKDLYTFDADLDSCGKTYEEINDAYQKFFEFLGVPWVKAVGCSGTIGGDVSHEYHLLSNIGEDFVLLCQDCREVFNEELLQKNQDASLMIMKGHSNVNVTESEAVPSCIKCQSTNLSRSKSIEVGHAFLLGTKYTKPFNSKALNKSGEMTLMEMGCYGLGISRILAAVVEVLSSDKCIKWPKSIAPYFISFLPPKAGSREETVGKDFSDKVESSLTEIFKNDLLIDDRLDLTVGKRLQDSKTLGIPYVLVFGKSVHNLPQQLVELHDVYSNEIHMMAENDVIKFLYDARSTTRLS